MPHPDNLNPDNLDNPCLVCGAEPSMPCVYTYPEDLRHRRHLTPTSRSGWKLKARTDNFMVTPHRYRAPTHPFLIERSMREHPEEWESFLTLFEETDAQGT